MDANLGTEAVRQNSGDRGSHNRRGHTPGHPTATAAEAAPPTHPRVGSRLSSWPVENNAGTGGGNGH